MKKVVWCGGEEGIDLEARGKKKIKTIVFLVATKFKQ